VRNRGGPAIRRRSPGWRLAPPAASGALRVPRLPRSPDPRRSLASRRGSRHPGLALEINASRQGFVWGTSKQGALGPHRLHRHGTNRGPLTLQSPSHFQAGGWAGRPAKAGKRSIEDRAAGHQASPRNPAPVHSSRPSSRVTGRPRLCAPKARDSAGRASANDQHRIVSHRGSVKTPSTFRPPAREAAPIKCCHGRCGQQRSVRCPQVRWPALQLSALHPRGDPKLGACHTVPSSW